MLHSSSAASQGQPLAFRKGDVQTVVGTVLCKQPCSAVPVATLAVTWQRSRCIHTKAVLQIDPFCKCITCGMHCSNDACILCAANDLGSDVALAGRSLTCWLPEEAETAAQQQRC